MLDPILSKLDIHKHKANLICIFIILFFAFGVLASIQAYNFSYSYINKGHQQKLQVIADERIYALKEQSERLTDIIYSLSGFFSASNYVDSDEFTTFFKTAFPNNKNISMFTWSPKVKKNNIDIFIAKAKAIDGYNDFKIISNNNHSNEEFYPVYHTLVNSKHHIKNHGLDMMTSFHDIELLKKSRDTGSIFANILVDMSHEIFDGSEKHSDSGEKQKFIELILPVYQSKQAINTVSDHRQSIIGFLSIHVDIEELVHSIMDNHPGNNKALDIHIFNNSNNENIYSHFSNKLLDDEQNNIDIESVRKGLYASKIINIANLQWNIILKPVSGSFDASSSSIPTTTFLLSMLFVLLCTGMFHISNRARQQTEKLVELRTSELNNSREETRAILDTITDGIVTINIFGVINTVNPAVLTLTGYQREELIGQNIKTLFSEESKHLYIKYIDDYLRNTNLPDNKNVTHNLELVGIRKKGLLIPFELTVNEMNVSNNLMLTCTIRDISERKKVEQLKNDFISTVSHELRTPLTSIRGALRLVLTKASDNLSEKAKKLLETADRNSERLTLLINDILDIEKIESGKLEFDFKSINITELTKTAIEANMEYANQQNVKLSLVNEPDNIMVWADEYRLLQVYANLISNAVKFSDAGSKIEISIEQSDGNVKIEVKDHGRGIPEKFGKKIFQRFAQADSSDAKEKGGTGLGLNISKAIIDRHDGNIYFVSEINIGTSFFFELPVWSEFSLYAGGTPKYFNALICEDNMDTANLLSELLEGDQIACDKASTITATETLLTNKHYDLLLLDLALPDGNGLALLKKIREKGENIDLRVIIISGQAQYELTEQNVEVLNIVDWIQKPIDINRLTRALKQATTTNSSRPKVLHVEDDFDIIKITKELLEENIDYHYATSYRSACKILGEEIFDIVIIDLILPDGSGVDLLNILQDNCPVIILSGIEPSSQISKQVAASLTKSRTTNDQLLKTIKNVLNQTKRAVA